VDLANKKNTTPTAVALAWLLRHPAGIVRLSTTDPKHVIENCQQTASPLREEWVWRLAAAAGVPSVSLSRYRRSIIVGVV